MCPTSPAFIEPQPDMGTGCSSLLPAEHKEFTGSALFLYSKMLVLSGWVLIVFPYFASDYHHLCVSPFICAYLPYLLNTT